MWYKTPIWLLCLMFLTMRQEIKDKDPIKSEFAPAVIAYYVPEKNYHPEQLPLDKLTHIIFSFTQVIDGEMEFRHPDNAVKLAQLVDQKERYPHLKVMVACGGWGADGFSDMALTEESRTRFANSVIKFIEKFQLDGLGMDWEYPSMPGPGIKFRAEDKQNFTLLMQKLREQLNTLDRPQTLTFASAGWKRYYDHIELLKVLPYVDYMNVMTYDQVVATSPYTGHHTPLGPVEESNYSNFPIVDYIEELKIELQQKGRNWSPRSVENIVSYCLENGVPPQQIVLGAAFYGRVWKGCTPDPKWLISVQ